MIATKLKEMRPEKWRLGSAQKILRLAQGRFFETCTVKKNSASHPELAPSFFLYLFLFCSLLRHASFFSFTKFHKSEKGDQKDPPRIPTVLGTVSVCLTYAPFVSS